VQKLPAVAVPEKVGVNQKYSHKKEKDLNK
jgi:hypothetical protein